MDSNLTRTTLRTAWIFQTILAAPTLLLYGGSAFLTIVFSGAFGGAIFYAFITDLCIAIMAGGIIFIVVVQFKLGEITHPSMRKLELWKSGLATAVWVWLMLDAIFGPLSQLGDGHFRQRRIVTAACTIIILIILFFPTVYCVVRLRSSRSGRGGPPAYDELDLDIDIDDDSDDHILEGSEMLPKSSRSRSTA